jgi:quinol monooxygenase YgiN
VFITIAIHHPRADHVADLMAHMRRVVEHTGSPEGMIDFVCAQEAGGSRLLGVARWESPEAFQAALPRVTALADQRDDAWSERPDELLTLTAFD